MAAAAAAAAAVAAKEQQRTPWKVMWGSTESPGVALPPTLAHTGPELWVPEAGAWQTKQPHNTYPRPQPQPHAQAHGHRHTHTRARRWAQLTRRHREEHGHVRPRRVRRPACSQPCVCAAVGSGPGRIATSTHCTAGSHARLDAHAGHSQRNRGVPHPSREYMRPTNRVNSAQLWGTHG